MFEIDKKRIFWKKSGDEIVILDVGSGIYYTLNEVGALVWEMALASKGVEEITKKIFKEYSYVREEEVKKDVARVLGDLARENIIIEK